MDNVEKVLYLFVHISFICLYLPDRWLAFNIFGILKLLLANLVRISTIIIAHHWVSSLVLVFPRHLSSSCIMSHFHPVWILNWGGGAVGRLLDGWFLSIDLAGLLSTSVQEWGTWVLLVSIIRHIILSLGWKVQSFCFLKTHTHLVRCCHSKSIIVVVLLGFREFIYFSWVVLEFVALHDNKAVDWKCAFFLQLRYWVNIHLLFDKTNDEFDLLFLYCVVLIGLNQFLQRLLLLVNHVVISLH